MNNKKRQRLMVRYLMGEVSDRERDELEEEYIRNREVLAELVSLENDLADSYACGEFNLAEARRFRQRYLTTPARRDKGAFSKVLMEYVSAKEDDDARQHHHKRFPYWQSFHGFLATGISRSALVISSLIVIAVAAGSWLLVADRRLHQAVYQEIRDLHDKQQQLAQQLPKPETGAPQATPAIAQKKEVVPVSSLPVIASLELSPHLTRGASQATILNLSPAVSSVKIKLNLENNGYSAFAVFVKSAEGFPVWKQRGLHSQLDRQNIQVVPFQVPSKVLQNGDYVVKLSGIAEGGADDDLGAYTFRVKRP